MEKLIICSASLAFYSFSSTCLIDEIKHDQSYKILFFLSLDIVLLLTRKVIKELKLKLELNIKHTHTHIHNGSHNKVSKGAKIRIDTIKYHT